MLVGFASLAPAQSTGARDGSRPSDGAIQGGSIAPGESGGMPDTAKGAKLPSDRESSRCNDLTGTLREQCLRQAQGASTGGTTDSTGPAGATPQREAPPPQNPLPRP